MGWLPVDVDTDPDVDLFLTVDPAELVDFVAALLLATQRPAWHADAACRGQGPAWWFPDRGHSPSTGIAICAGCPVRGECRAFALADPSTDGIWAGTSKATRIAMRRRKAA